MPNRLRDRPDTLAAPEPSTRDLYRSAFDSSSDVEGSRPSGGRGTEREAARAGAALAGWLTFLAGAWLVFAPYAVGYAGVGGIGGHRSDVLTGGAVALVALVRLASPVRLAAIGLLNVLLGGWLAISPFVLGYSADVSRETWNEVITGLLVAVLALVGFGLGLAARGPRRRDEPR